jgi:hypothetical protein
LAPKQKGFKPVALPQEDLLRPFWYDLPAAFYFKVNKAATELGMTRKALVSQAVDMFIKESRRERRQAVLPATPVQEELVRDFQRRAGALRWKDVSPEERAEMMRKIAEARWGSKKALPPQKAVKKTGRKKS